MAEMTSFDMGHGWVGYMYCGGYVETDSVTGRECVTAADIAVMENMSVDAAEKIVARGNEQELRRLINAQDDARMETGKGWIGWTEMPGYLDRTENVGVFDSEAECREMLMNMYGGDDDE